MEANNIGMSRFWTYLGGLLTFEAPLWNWRQRLGNDIDFEHFRETYLLPTNKTGSLIICPQRCDYSCGFRKVRENGDETFRAVCHKNKKDAFLIAKKEVLIYGVNYGVLLPKTALSLGIQPLIAPFQTWNEAWKMGTLRVSDRILPVFFTLRNWNHKVIDLILNLNRTENQPYILLVTSTKVISPTSLKALEDSGSLFLPLNEVLDFNRDAEPMLIRPLESFLKNLIQVTLESVIHEKSGWIRKETRLESDYWYVGGELKKVYHREKRQSIQARILNILYDQIGNCWIPHQTFLNATGWTLNEYLGDNDNSGRMQKQLFLIRRDFNLEIIFSREHGVKLSPNITEPKK